MEAKETTKEAARVRIVQVRAVTGFALCDLTKDSRSDLRKLTAAIEALQGRSPNETKTKRTQGYSMLTAQAVRRISDTAQRFAANEYKGTDSGMVAGIAVDRTAAYLPTLRNPHTFLASASWQAGLARRIAEDTARTMPSGGGSMARLPEDFERASGSLYSPWMDSWGMTAPAIGNLQRAIGIAPGIPERDAPSLAIQEPFAAHIGKGKDRELVLAALDETYMNTRGGWTVPWQAVARKEAKRTGTKLTARTARDRTKEAIVAMLPAQRSPKHEAKRYPKPERDPFEGSLAVPEAQYPKRSWFTKREPEPWNDAHRIAPPQEAVACCEAHRNPERANRLRAVVGREPLTEARCAVAR